MAERLLRVRGAHTHANDADDAGIRLLRLADWSRAQPEHTEAR
jgi:hypothetical protein